MECYVCGTPRPEGANYCPGCGRYCADDPNVPRGSAIAPEDIHMEEPVAPPAALDEVIPVEEPAAESNPAPEETPAEPDAYVRKKKHRPVLIPIVIMGCLFLLGTVLWFVMPYDRPPADLPTETTAPPHQKPNLPSGTRPSQDDMLMETYPPTDERCFRIENGVVSFVPERYDGDPILVIPDQIDGQTVTGIAPGGFSDLEDVTTLVLPETLESIGDFAFANCKKLRGVYIPDSVTSIESGAFSGCIDMESVSIPVTTTSIGYCAFDGCASLMYIFYEGTHEQWVALYNEYITPFTYAICSDGDYYHGVDIP